MGANHYGRTRLAGFPAVLGILLAWTAPAGSQPIREDFPIPNGPIHALAEAGGTLYVGGSFTRIGARATYGAIVSVATGGLVPSPTIDWLVLTADSDGQGGWFIGGLFDNVGGVPHNNLAHILADGTVASWNPIPASNVLVVAVDGSTVYVGGIFIEMNGVSRIKAAALDAGTGALKAWNPGIEYVTSNNVQAIAVAGGRVYLGGEFYIGGQARRNVAAVHPTTGALLNWDPIVDGPVFAIAVGDSAVYLGGRFSTVDGAPRANLAAVDLFTGRVTPWNPGTDGDVNTLQRRGSTLYVGGGFTSVGGVPRGRLAAFDLASGALTAWDPGVSGTVSVLADPDSTIYVGGSFPAVGGLPRDNVAAVDSATARPTGWDPGAHESVYALVPGAAEMFVGGGFMSIGGKRRHNLAAIDVATGAVTDWNPGTNGIVRALVAGEGPTLYAGGAFDTVGGKRRRQIAAIVGATGVVTNWDPNAYGSVYSLAISGPILYAGGNFNAIGGQPRDRIAAVDLATGLATPWSPGADNIVRAIMPHGGVVYAGGSFLSIGGSVRPCIAALDPATGAATLWSPPVTGTNPDVYALAARGSSLYVGGDFTQIGGAPRYGLAALDTATGGATAWAPASGGTRYSLALAGVRASGAPEIVYAGGDGVEALDGETAAHKGWYPPVFGPVYALEIDGPSFFAGGDFGATGVNRLRLAAAVELSTPTLVAMFAAEAVAEGIVLRWRFGSDRFGDVWIERADRVTGPWVRTVLDVLEEGGTYGALDRAVEPGRTYHYRLVAGEGARDVTLGEITATAGARYLEPALTRVMPVPSAGSTAIEFVLAHRGHVRLSVFDLEGRLEAELVNGDLEPGKQLAAWNGAGRAGRTPPGIYFVRLETGGRSIARRIALRR